MLPTKSSPNETQQAPSTSPSLEADDKSGSKVAGRWTKEEHELFVDGLKKFGKNWKKIEEHVGTRSGAQIRSHAQKFFLRLSRDVGLKEKYPMYSMCKQDLSTPIRKISGSSNSTDISYQDGILAKISNNNLQKYLELNRRFENSLNVATLLDSQLTRFTPTVEELYMIQQQRQRKANIEALQMNSMSNPLLDAIASNIKSNQMSMEMTRLNTLINLNNQNQRLMNSNLSNNLNLNNLLSMNNITKNNYYLNESPLAANLANLRKFSEDNILIQNKPTLIPQFHAHQLSDFEPLVKQIKKF